MPTVNRIPTCNEIGVKDCIELIRVSTAGQAADDRAGIPAQHSVNRQTAERYGLTITHSIEMSDVSGASVLSAPEIAELISRMNSPDIHGVVCREFSRLMRPESFSDFALLQAFADTNTLLYTPEGPTNFANPDGRLIGGLRALIAGNERIEMQRRIFTARETKRKRGELAQSKICLPYGVDYLGGTRWAWKPEADQVREAFRLFASGNTSFAAVGDTVGIEAYNLRNILRNPIYTGWRVIDKKRDMRPSGKYVRRDGRQGDRRKILRTPDEVIRVKLSLEPLVSEAEFNQVQELIRIKRERRTKPTSRFVYNGFLRCAKCQDLIYTKFQRRDVYVCKRRYAGHACDSSYMRKEFLETRLNQLLAKDMSDPGFLNGILESMKKHRPLPKLADLSKRAKALESKRAKVLDDYYNGVTTVTERDSRLIVVERERQALALLLAKERPNPTIDLQTCADVFSVFTEFDWLDRAEKRRLLSGIAAQIFVAKDENRLIVKGLSFIPGVNHTDTGSSPPPT